MSSLAIEELKKLGFFLRGKREERHLSLKDIENATSIRMSHLDAIELGDYTKFFSRVYFFGFMRQYASYLELDYDKLMREYPSAFRLEGEKHDFAYGIGTLEKRGSANGGVKWLPTVVWALAVGVVVISAYYFAKFMGIF